MPRLVLASTSRYRAELLARLRALLRRSADVAQTLPVIGSSVSPDIISMIPYIVTILAVAGFVGKVRAPAAEGVPYP